ncbi:DUF2752 domain-containing protein [Brachybacterium sp. DNPG3]
MTSAVRPPHGGAPDGARRGGAHRALLPMGILLGGGVLALGIQSVFDPFRQDIPLCPVYHLTGLYCPGCGATRAVHALIDGDLLLAMQNNVLIVIAAPLVVLGLLWWTVRRMLGRPALPLPSTRTMLVLVALAVLFAVLRNIPAFWFIAPTSLVGA